MRPYTVALTGGIASGKSSVAQWFAQQGIVCVDADVIARQLVAPDQPALAAIVDHFGRDVLTETGQLNRAMLRSLIFADREQKAWLESYLHPLIQAEMRRGVEEAQSPYVLAVIPLLQEVGKPDYSDRVLLTDCPVELQLSRLMARDGIDEPLAWSMIHQQASREARLALADDVIDSQIPLTSPQMQQRLMLLHQGYLLK